MKRIPITIKLKTEESYHVIIGDDILTQLDKLIDFSIYTKLVVITDETTGKWWHKKLMHALPQNASTITLPPGEKAKTIYTIEIIWKELLKICCDRKSLVINFGGGGISDMGGFATSTFMRGVDFINIPTTLLAQVDASVGGKTGFNFAGIKNLIGNFTQPKAVIIDVAVLTTLPEREFLSGFAEIIKHGLITDKNYFKKVTSKKPLLFSSEELVEIITRSCEIKAAIVAQDEKESGKRELLNFGHTIGHAIEALSLETKNPLLHGEAISIGMSAEAVIAHKIGLLSKDASKIIKEKLNEAGLPTTLPDFKREKIIEKIKSDKKNFAGNINFSLLKQIGEGVCNQSVSEKIIKSVLANI